jgi:hypothetical protein
MELQLLENPRRFNPAGYDAYNNPILVESYRNPSRGKKSKRRNPMRGMTQIKQWTQGVDLTDTAGAVGGLAAATMIPANLPSTTTSEKLIKLGASALCAMGAGFVAGSVFKGKAKSAVLGGLAGTAVQGLAMFTSINIQGRQIGASPRRVGTAVPVSQPASRSGETVSIIEP